MLGGPGGQVYFDMYKNVPQFPVPGSKTTFLTSFLDFLWISGDSKGGSMAIQIRFFRENFTFEAV